MRLNQLLFLTVVCLGGCAESVDPPKSLSISPFNIEQICMASIAMMNSHSPKYDKVSSAGGIVSLFYTRKTDGKKFQYNCRLSGSEVKWQLSPYTNWSTNNQLYFNVEGDRLNVKQVVGGQTVDSEFYTVTDLNI